MFFVLDASLVTNLGGRWESYEVFTSPLNWQLESGDRLEVSLEPNGERLPGPFEIADGVVIPAGPYHWLRYGLEVEAAAKRRLSGEVNWWSGGFYGGTLNQLELEGSWTPSPIVTLLASAEHNAGRLPWGDFDETFLGLKIRFNLSPDLQLRSFLQYDTESRSLGTNTRLRWTFRAQGDLFVIYNHNLRDTEQSWQRQDNQLLVKLQYAFRR
jgi:hypothetical protein